MFWYLCYRISEAGWRQSDENPTVGNAAWNLAYQFQWDTLRIKSYRKDEDFPGLGTWTTLCRFCAHGQREEAAWGTPWLKLPRGLHRGCEPQSLWGSHTSPLVTWHKRPSLTLPTLFTILFWNNFRYVEKLQK